MFSISQGCVCMMQGLLVENMTWPCNMGMKAFVGLTSNIIKDVCGYRKRSPWKDREVAVRKSYFFE